MTNDRMARAREKGAQFLISKQHGDGKWSDFELEVGRSTAWTTAYVATTLSHIPTASSSIEKACKWLLKNFRNGWGFNESVPIDCDSTAWGIMALRGAGQESPIPSDQLLSEFRDETGLFCTFSGRAPEDSWGKVHLDVTAVAVRALLRTPTTDNTLIIESVSRIIELGENSHWHSYWWSDQMYGIAHSLETLNEFVIWLNNRKIELGTNCSLKARIAKLQSFYGTQILENSTFTDALSGSLLIKACGNSVNENKFLRRLTDLLLDLQEPDGRWRAAPNLRVTYPNISEPWKHKEPGPLFADVEDIFTTASVIDALKIFA